MSHEKSRWKAGGFVFIFIMVGGEYIFGQTERGATFSNQQVLQERFAVIRQVMMAAQEGSIAAQELELTDQQKAGLSEITSFYSQEIRKILDEFNANNANSTGDATAADDEERRFKERDDRMVALADQIDLRLNEILLPHQVYRLRQLSLQQGNRGQICEPELFVLVRLKERLHLSASEETDLDDLIAKTRDEYRKEFRSLKDRYNQQIINSLSEPVRKQVEELLGDLGKRSPKADSDPPK